MKSAIIALMLCLSLASCAGATSNQDLRRLTAPAVKNYSREKQEAAAKEIESGKAPVLTEFAQDYCVMRDQSRVLAGEKPRCTTSKERKVWKFKVVK